MRRQLALACCLLVAGCAGVGPTLPGAPGEGVTVTPAPVPGVSPSDVSGLTARGVTDADAVVAAHRERLSNRSVRVDAVYVVRYRDGGVRRYERTTGLFGANRSRFYLPTDRYTPGTAPGGAHRGVWSNGSAVLVMRIEDGDTTYGGRRGHETRTPRSLYRLDLRDTLAAARNVTVERTDAGYLVTGTVPSAALAGRRPPATGNATLAATVDGGLVRELRLSYPARVAGAPVTVEHRLRHDRVGTAAVYRPFWVETAAGTLAASGAERGNASGRAAGDGE